MISDATKITVHSSNLGCFDFLLADHGGAIAQLLGSPAAIRVTNLPEGRDAFVAEPLPTASVTTPQLPPFWFRRALDRTRQDLRAHAGASLDLADPPTVRPSATPSNPTEMKCKFRELMGIDTFKPAIYVPKHLQLYTTGEQTGTVHTAKGTVRPKDILGIGGVSEFKERIIALAKEYQVACRVDDNFTGLNFMAFAVSERDVNRFCKALYREVEKYNGSCPVISYGYGPSLLDDMKKGIGNLWYNLFTRR